MAGEPETLPRRTAPPRSVRLDPGGPVLVEGPIEVSTGDGEPQLIDRFLVALCACGRSARYPLCDGTHRQLLRDDVPSVQGGKERGTTG